MAVTNLVAQVPPTLRPYQTTAVVRQKQKRKILALVADGLSELQIADYLGITRSAVRYAKNPERTRQRLAAWRAANPDKQETSNKKWRSNNPELVRKRASAWAKKNPHRVRAARLKATYGITVDQYNTMLIKQNGVCAICRRPETEKSASGRKGRSLAVDHCHETKRFRGILCNKCNQAIGCLRDDPALCLAAAEYLR